MINIASASPPPAGSNPDICLWRDKANGICSAALAYDRITAGSWEPKDKKWKNVWKIRGPQRVRQLIWSANKRLAYEVCDDVDTVYRGTDLGHREFKSSSYRRLYEDAYFSRHPQGGFASKYRSFGFRSIMRKTVRGIVDKADALRNTR
ncbi:hypothetical protein GOBAR_AA28053 [Gossypium barbadense]|uniref:Reverse transcriptase zinc-binding domain-containing protein n=1 Tax=Gossypium barbadense TaxID=3634 RepID=A0A2P5WNF0_GOSBA|nr:hypothetical protein GOBAR_AA28053 [Gossypium barbadense]